MTVKGFTVMHMGTIWLTLSTLSAKSSYPRSDGMNLKEGADYPLRRALC
jgi:hypothetical protein